MAGQIVSSVKYLLNVVWTVSLWHWFLVSAFLGIVDRSPVLHLDHRLLSVPVLFQIFLNVPTKNKEY